MSLPYRSGKHLCSSLCPVDHIDIAGDRIEPPLGAWPDIRGLHSLNYSRDKWLTGDAIEVSMATYCRGLPQILQDKVELAAPGLHPKVWSQGEAGNEVLHQAINAPARRALEKMKAKEYNIFPICTDGNHWVLVILHKEQRPSATDDTKMEWSHIAQMAVLDPYRQSTVISLVCHRLASWLYRAGHFTFAASYRRSVWIPLQNDSTSCGPRAYWNAKQILDRLLELHENNLSYHPSLWSPLSGWFNEDFVRGEMVGRCASAAVRGMGYKARIAVECVDRVMDKSRSNAQWKDAGELMRPADLRDMVPEARPQMRRQLWTALEIPGGAGEVNMYPTTPSTARSTTTTTDNAPGRRPSTPGYMWKPPARVPNQHLLIAPGVRPTASDMHEGPRSTEGRGPAWPQSPRRGNSLLPPRAGRLFTPPDSGSGAQESKYATQDPSSEGTEKSNPIDLTSEDEQSSPRSLWTSRPQWMRLPLKRPAADQNALPGPDKRSKRSRQPRGGG